MKQKIKTTVIAYLFIFPSLLGIVVFYIVPYIICLIKSLYAGQEFVGLKNYIQLFSNNTFLLALKNTAIFTFTAIPFLMIISFLLALFLNSFQKISSFFRSAFLIPVVVPVIGLNKIEFFNSEFSMVMIIIIYIWKYCGFCVILFTAGLANVNHSLYESAQLDGANSFQLVTRITIPLITPTTFFVFLMEIIYSFKIFREVFALFGEYPNKNVYFLQNFINNNYYNLNYPRLSSASIIMSVMIIALMFVFFMFERRYSYSE